MRVFTSDLESTCVDITRWLNSWRKKAVDTAIVLVVDQMNKFKHDADFWENEFHKERERFIGAVEAERERIQDAVIQALAALKSADPHSYQNSLYREKAIEKLEAIRSKSLGGI